MCSFGATSVGSLAAMVEVGVSDGKSSLPRKAVSKPRFLSWNQHLQLPRKGTISVWVVADLQC